MGCPISFQPLKALPLLSPPKCRSAFSICGTNKLLCSSKAKPAGPASTHGSNSVKSRSHFVTPSNLVIQVGLLSTVGPSSFAPTNWITLPILFFTPKEGNNLAPDFQQVAEPALAVTGVNNEEDLVWVLVKVGVVAFWYFLIMPPIIMNWLRIRWYRRNLLEMYLQFMFVFMFFPGVLLWAPFLNFRKFPRDPSMKYPWSKPQNPSQVRGGFLKYPWATVEDYE